MCLAVVCLVPAVARAYDDDPDLWAKKVSSGWGSKEFAESYADKSASILSQAELIGVPSASGMVAANGGTAGIIGLGVTARFVFNHFVIQPSLGVANVGLFVGSSSQSAAIFEGGLGLGAAVAVSDRVAFTPMARTWVLGSDQGSALAAVAGDLPLAIFFGKNGFMEPYLEVGALGVPQMGAWTFMIGGGYRLGVTF